MDTRILEEHNPRPEFELKKDEQKTKLYLSEISPIINYIPEIKLTKSHVNRPLTVLSVKGQQAKRLAYLQNNATYFGKYILEILYLTFSFDKIHWEKLKNSAMPLALACASYHIGNGLTHKISDFMTGDENNDFGLKFVLSTALLYHSAQNNLTLGGCPSNRFSLKAAAELLAIANLFSGSFIGCEKLLSAYFNEAYTFILSLAISGLVIPTSIASLIRHWQQKKYAQDMHQGSQRLESAMITGGLTPVANVFFQIYFILKNEFNFTRKFQVGLIANNIIDGGIISQRLRNLPSFLVDLTPQVIRKLLLELRKVQADYQKNNQKVFMLNQMHQPAILKEVSLHELRAGDLVWCGKNINSSAVPITGELWSFERDVRGDFHVQKPVMKEAYVNLKSYTGENLWIKNKTQLLLSPQVLEIDQKKIQDHSQAGVLVGAELDLMGEEKDFFIKVGRKKEVLNTQIYEKKSIINQVINEYKQRNIVLAGGVSLLVGFCLNPNPLTLPQVSAKLLFTLFQMMIPFSESFLREMVNSRLLKSINYPLLQEPMELIDALRLTDFWHTLSGHYSDRFPKGSIIISDKTGTLTTTEMKTLGIWTEDMPAQIKFGKNEYLPKDYKNLILAFEVFAAAFTVSKKDLEPEEHSILDFFKQTFCESNCLEVKTVDHNHYLKTLKNYTYHKTIETIHLGLFHHLGGRLTLVREEPHFQLVFCGIPKRDKFADSDLLQSYLKMEMRRGVLSRDWCVGRCELTEAQFTHLINLFNHNDAAGILEAIEVKLLKSFRHFGTFLINNPVKPGVEKFIKICHNMQLPVIIATGDTPRAAENIVKVLCPEAKGEPTRRAHIFPTLSELNLQSLITALDEPNPPLIIFASMTTQNKGQLAEFLQGKGYFIVANGDGTNDAAMMRVANFVIAHRSPEGGFAPQVSQYVNLSDQQLQTLNKSPDTFYDLFDIDQREESQFILPFISLANAQEMVSYALNFKPLKMGFEFARALGFNQVQDVWQQAWFGIFYDIAYLLITLPSILENADLPTDQTHLSQSTLGLKCLLATVALAAFQSFFCYQALGKTTDITLILVQLALLPVFLKSFFQGFSAVQTQYTGLTDIEQKKLARAPKQVLSSKLGLFKFKEKKSTAQERGSGNVLTNTCGLSQ